MHRRCTIIHPFLYCQGWAGGGGGGGLLGSTPIVTISLKTCGEVRACENIVKEFVFKVPMKRKFLLHYVKELFKL